jgi:hypothetical protein
MLHNKQMQQPKSGPVMETTTFAANLQRPAFCG